MRAIVQKEFGGPDRLFAAEIPVPVPGPSDLLVNVRAIGLNPIDAKARQDVAGWGRLQGNELAVLGWDCAGVVAAVGAQAGNRFSVGDRVWFAGNLGRAGCHAEWTAVDARLVSLMPKNLDFAQAAALPLTALTAWEGLIERCGLVPRRQANGNKSALVIGGAGGVGSIAIQLLKRVCGLRVVATASREASRRYCQELGADVVIDHPGDLAVSFAKAALPAVDVILCGSDPATCLETMAAVLAPGGHLCALLPLMGPVNTFGFFGLHASLHFEFIFSRPLLGVEQAKHGEILATIAALVEAGDLRSTLNTTLPWTLDHVVGAHRDIEAGHCIGKTVFVVDAS